ncbi:hypothetical protein KEM55_001804, partial [Ascosphaera atra]
NDNVVADSLSHLPGDIRNDGIPSTTDPTGCTLQSPESTAWVATRSARPRGSSGGSRESTAESVEVHESPPGPGALAPCRARATLPLPGPQEDRECSHLEILITPALKRLIKDAYGGDVKWQAIIAQLQEKEKTLEEDMPLYPYTLYADGLLWQHFPHLCLCLPTAMVQEIF